MSNKKPVRSTIAYVDGFNLYRGMMDPRYQIKGDNSTYSLRKYLWLDLTGYVNSFFPKYYEISRVHFFTAAVKGNPGAARRQAYYWKALESTPLVTRHMGEFIPKGIDPQTGNTVYSEKKSDAQLALQAYSDAIHEKPDCMAFVTADSDQVPTIERIQKLHPKPEVRIIFPPARGSDELRGLVPSHQIHKTKYDRLRDNQFPDIVHTDTFSVARPSEWS